MPVSPGRPLPVGVRAELFRHLAAMEQAGVPVDLAFAALQLPAGVRAGAPAHGRLPRPGA